MKYKQRQNGTDCIAEIFQLYPDAPLPVLADPALLGTIPLRAYKYCQPLTAASSYGWYTFPPIDFELLWDGTTTYWRIARGQHWNSVQNTALPGFTEHYLISCPIRDQVPNPMSFLTTGPEPGIIQIWTGLVARTRKDWNLLLRTPANLPRPLGFDVFEGIIETDWWMGPLFGNLRLTKTDSPIAFSTREPLFQLQPILREAYSQQTLGSASISRGLKSLPLHYWQEYAKAIRLRWDQSRPGSYKREVRRRAGEDKP